MQSLTYLINFFLGLLIILLAEKYVYEPIRNKVKNKDGD